jgi:hypothetical protein
VLLLRSLLFLVDYIVVVVVIVVVIVVVVVVVGIVVIDCYICLPICCWYCI